MNQKIKHITLLCIILGSLLSMGCNKTIEEIESQDILRFGCDSIAATRGASYDNGALNALLSMGVYSSSTAGNWTATAPLNFMVNQKVERANATSPWTYTPEVYWPGSGKSTFFAYAPHDHYKIMISGTTGIPKMEFDVPLYVTNHVDLLVAAPIVDQTKASSTLGRINFQMAHALSRISFAAKIANATPDDVRITSIALRNVYGIGSFQMSSTDLNMMPKTGANPTASYTIAQNVRSELLTPQLTTEYQRITSDMGYMFLIPQSTPANAEVVISYSINGTAEPKPITIKLAEAISKWQSGEALRLLINISTNVPFGADLGYTFEPWTNIDINVPIEENPYLYVSDIKAKVYDGAVTRIYFHTNQPLSSVFIDPVARQATPLGTAINVKDKFMNIVADGNFGTGNFVYNQKDGRGYIDFVNIIPAYVDSRGEALPNAPSTGDQTPILVRLRAGKLDYYITLTTHITPLISQTSSGLIAPGGLFYYSSTFHRRNEVGERIVTWFVPNDRTWTATIDNAGDGAELLLDRIPSPDYEAGLLYGLTPRDAEGTVVTDWTSTVNGKRTLTGRGRVYFRVGWKSKATTANRYAKIEVTTPQQTYIYCRQGEEPDYIAHPTDDKFSPYNLVGDGSFGGYPTQGGFISQWGRPRQWPLVGDLAPAGYPTTAITEALDKDVAICPQGYTYPDNQTIAQYFSSTLPLNIAPGFCADGYFDRRHEKSQRVDPESIYNASVGVVLFNQLDVRSIFFATPGYRDMTGILRGINKDRGDIGGMIGHYWTSVQHATDNTKAIGFRFKSAGGVFQRMEVDKRFSALVRCIKVTDPIYLSFVADGAQNVTRPSTVKKNTTAYVPKKIPTDYWRPGYFFYGWNTNQDGTGTTIFPGSDLPMTISNVTLYAMWSQYIRVDFKSVLTATQQTEFTSTNSYSSYTTAANGTKLGTASFTGANGILTAATAEKAYASIEFHKDLNAAATWEDAYDACKNLSDPDRASGAKVWRLPRVTELLMMSQHAAQSTWAIAELFGGKGEDLWSGTEHSANNGYRVIFYNSNAENRPKSETRNFRCVREF